MKKGEKKKTHIFSNFFFFVFFPLSYVHVHTENRSNKNNIEKKGANRLGRWAVVWPAGLKTNARRRDLQSSLCSLCSTSE